MVLKVKIGQTFDSNAETKTSIADITYGVGQSYLRYNLGYTDSGNYETGTGIKPKTEYRTSNNAITYGSRLGDGSKLSFLIQTINRRTLVILVLRWI
ncbi:MAG: hypothetical protein CM15mP69_5490 [Ectothiorhodospiraceae bacterium]|nr:MAG: hypothetical protein CM15mP69_5490 [Ectothiorhodospiraceae bacterium]